MCDTLVVVWPDRVGFAKNSDRDPNEAQRLQWMPAAEYSSDSVLRCTWIAIPQVRQTQAVLLSRPFWMWGAEMGTNSAGLVIGNEAVFTTAKIDETGLTGMDLVRLALERASSVQQAVDVIGQLIAAHGQGGRCGYSHPGFRYHNSFLIADGRQAAVLETAGRDVAVQWVRSGVRAISNGLTLPELVERSDRLRSTVAQCVVRRERMEALGATAVGPGDLAAALRDHGADSSGPHYRRLNGALSAPCAHWGGWLAGTQTVASWISILTPHAAQHWATGTSAPCLSMFRPISLDRPRELGTPEGMPDASSLWWKFERLHRAALRNLPATTQMRAERNQIEQAALENPTEQDIHWQAADDWLDRWLQRLDGHHMNLQPDTRPRWLQRRWLAVDREAAAGSRLPSRDD
ncbi:MAG: hypothetical protein KF752_08820 [Pirellulaceae bacterium]|nr:hypothetical protein [Pirellulaceae bacterium]